MDTRKLAFEIINAGMYDVAKQNAFDRGPLTKDDIQAAADWLSEKLAAQSAPAAEPTDTERELFQCLDAFIKRADIKHDGPNLDRDARGVAALLSDSHPRGYAAVEPSDKFNRWYGFDVRRSGPAELTATLSADTFDVFPHDEFMSGTDPVHEIFRVVVDVERAAARCIGAGRVGNAGAHHEIDQGPGRNPTAVLSCLLDDVARDMGRGMGWHELDATPTPTAGNLRAQLLLEGAADLQREACNLLWPVDDEPTPF